MASYLVQATYTAEGLKGLAQDRASGRKAALEETLAGLGGRVESFYYSFGDYDVVMIVEIPDNVAAFALTHTISAVGLARTKTTPLLSVAEVDRALVKSVAYKEPGQYATCPGFRSRSATHSSPNPVD